MDCLKQTMVCMGIVSLLDNLYSFFILGLFNPAREVCVRVLGKKG